MYLLKKFLNNTGNPEGLLGRIMVKSMNQGHSAVSDWGMAHITGLSPCAILELGCGGGRNAAKLLRLFPGALVQALDHSPVSVQKTEQLNRRQLRRGKLRVTQASVEQLPFPAGSFDLATAFETVYFWPGPLASFKEVERVLKKGGWFLIVNESDGTGRSDAKWMKIIDNMRIYTPEQLEAFLRQAGFSQIRIDQDRKKHHVCILAQK